MTRLEAEVAWHIEWTFRRPPAVGSDAWHQVADEYFRRMDEMRTELDAVNEETIGPSGITKIGI